MEETQTPEPEIITSLDSQEVEHLVDEHIAQMQVERENSRRQMELIQFGILAAILLGTVFILAISQPLVFGRIVPSVMGEGQAAEASVDDADAAPVDNVGQPTAVPQPDSNTQDPEQGGGAPTGSEDPVVEEATAVPAQIYVVQAGDTLNSIAGQFNTTVEAIVAVNDIQDPNNVLVGTTLNIPQP